MSNAGSNSNSIPYPQGDIAGGMTGLNFQSNYASLQAHSSYVASTVAGTNGPTTDTHQRRAGILKVSYSLLKELLSLPEDCKISHVYDSYANFNEIQIVIDSPNIPEIIQGEVLPVITKEQLSGFDL